MSRDERTLIVSDGFCHGCGEALPPKTHRGRDRKWCSERCRKASYGDPCVDCGAKTRYGAERARIPEPRCAACAPKHYAYWTCEQIIKSVHDWVAEYGEPPAAPDWMPSKAKSLNDPDRERRGREGIAARRHPDARWVFERFGSWNALIRAAGYPPRAPHGGGSNVLRRRAMRARAAA